MKQRKQPTPEWSVDAAQYAQYIGDESYEQTPNYRKRKSPPFANVPLPLILVLETLILAPLGYLLGFLTKVHLMR